LKAKQTYLKGKSIFKVSLFVVGVTILIVYLTGENYERTITSNSYLSLTIIGTALFLFMTYGLYKGIGLVDDFPEFKKFKTGSIIKDSGTIPDLPSLDIDDDIGGIFVSIILWILMTILLFLLLILLEAVLWASIFIILAMLYWVFFRSLRLVFSKASKTKGNLGISAVYSISYTLLYIGWIFGIIFLTEILNF